MKNYKKVMALFMAATMVTGLAACGGDDGETKSTPTPTPSGNQGGGDDTPAPTEEPGEEDLGSYTLRIDPATGEAYDLGGMTVVIRDWWSDHEAEKNLDSAYAEAQDAYRTWIQETYNFTIYEQAISGWGSIWEDMQTYATTGGDENNYVFTMRVDGNAVAQINAGLWYDVSKITSCDVAGPKYDSTIANFATRDGGAQYAFRKMSHEPRTGIYFNKRLLREAGIDPEEIYELQRNHEWTWDTFEDYLKKVQRDTDGDGVNDVWGFFSGTDFTGMSLLSNGGEYIGYENGQYVFKADSDATIEALNWQKRIIDTYNCPNPGDAAENWDYFDAEFKAGRGVFFCSQAYRKGQQLSDMEDELGFVCYPMGPRKNIYTDVMQDNIHAMPACYDDARANKIMLAYDLYFAPIPGFEDYSDYYAGYVSDFDDMTVPEETIAFMGESTAMEYQGFVQGINVSEDLIYKINENNTAAQQIEAVRASWQAYIDYANGVGPDPNAEEEGEGGDEQ